jgi:hypothetical protein
MRYLFLITLFGVLVIAGSIEHSSKAATPPPRHAIYAGHHLGDLRAQLRHWNCVWSRSAGFWICPQRHP